MTEIDILVRRLPIEIQMATEGILAKIARIKPFGQNSAFSPEEVEARIDEVFARFNSRSRPVERSEPTLVIQTISESDFQTTDVKWAIMLANADLDCIHCLFPPAYSSEVASKRQTISTQLDSLVEKQFPFSYYAQSYSKLALQLALLSDQERIQNFYPKGNPVEPLVDLCAMGTRPLGIINREFVIRVPQRN